MKIDEKLDNEEERPVPDYIRPRHYWDEDVPESLETSPDEDFGSPTQNEDHGLGIFEFFKNSDKNESNFCVRQKSQYYFQASAQKIHEKAIKGCEENRPLKNRPRDKGFCADQEDQRDGCR